MSDKPSKKALEKQVAELAEQVVDRERTIAGLRELLDDHHTIKDQYFTVLSQKNQLADEIGRLERNFENKTRNLRETIVAQAIIIKELRK